MLELLRLSVNALLGYICIVVNAAAKKDVKMLSGWPSERAMNPAASLPGSATPPRFPVIGVVVVRQKPIVNSGLFRPGNDNKIVLHHVDQTMDGPLQMMSGDSHEQI
jgi:hypothetical protein